MVEYRRSHIGTQFRTLWALQCQVRHGHILLTNLSVLRHIQSNPGHTYCPLVIAPALQSPPPPRGGTVTLTKKDRKY